MEVEVNTKRVTHNGFGFEEEKFVITHLIFNNVDSFIDWLMPKINHYRQNIEFRTKNYTIPISIENSEYKHLTTRDSLEYKKIILSQDSIKKFLIDNLKNADIYQIITDISVIRTKDKSTYDRLNIFIQDI